MGKVFIINSHLVLFLSRTVINSRRKNLCTELFFFAPFLLSVPSKADLRETGISNGVEEVQLQLDLLLLLNCSRQIVSMDT